MFEPVIAEIITNALREEDTVAEFIARASKEIDTMINHSIEVSMKALFSSKK